MRLSRSGLGAGLSLVAGAVLATEGVIPAPGSSKDLAAISLGAALILVYYTIAERALPKKLALIPIALALGVAGAARGYFDPALPLRLKTVLALLGGATAGICLASLISGFFLGRDAARGPRSRKAPRASPQTRL